ncbi:MAG TPA: TylF/MycF/NovP-related O-methyltransferase [Bryobacteraceae bacterium]|nr:TylF/MycF/NovP-related O-methyltransferase [Bryobacteraceae bacterium]
MLKMNCQIGSTRDALVALYDKVSLGDYIIVDDYGEDHWSIAAAPSISSVPHVV